MAKRDLKPEPENCVKLFLPPEVPQAPLDLETLRLHTGKRFQYTSKGRHAIGHVLRSLQPEHHTVLISPYMCPTVEQKLRSMAYHVDFFDIDPSDLNPSPESIRARLQETGAAAVIAASLYGNPADMTSIERICREEGVLLIDDGAQSFGSKLDGRWIGCFGNGGLLSFSPGKATAGHMGALFWTERDYEIRRTHHDWIHRISYLNFAYNRQNIYRHPFTPAARILQYMDAAAQKFFSTENDDLAPFETPILGGILAAAETDALTFRREVLTQFLERFGSCDMFRIVQAQRGQPCTHKIVLIFDSPTVADSFCAFLTRRSVFTYRGYTISPEHIAEFPGCRAVAGRIAELPMEANTARMAYMMDCVSGFLETYKA